MNESLSSKILFNAFYVELRPPKSRHYDQTQVQLYMAKQKEDRRKKQAELRRHEKETNEKIARHLNELDKRQRETRKRKIKAGNKLSSFQFCYI